MIEKIKCLYEDNHLLIIEKPHNLPVQEDISGDEDVLSLLKRYIKEKYNKPGDVFLGLVHRLDRPAGGVMVFGRTSKAASRLSEQIRSRQMQKTYLAITKSRYSSLSGTYENYLQKDKEKNHVNVVSFEEPGSQKAILQYEVLKEEHPWALVKINLETGRPHQIRVQFSYNGHPLSGDKKYGENNPKGYTNTLALWSYALVFKHPVKDEVIHVKSKPPDEYPWSMFKAQIDRL